MGWLQDKWDWFWYYRKGRVRYRVWNNGEYYYAMASDGKVYVCNCYGNTPETAIEMARFKLQQSLTRGIDESNVLYRQKL